MFTLSMAKFRQPYTFAKTTLASTNYTPRREIDLSGPWSALTHVAFGAVEGLTPGHGRPKDDEQRSRLLALGPLDLTAETSRWVHAARTWQEAWHGVLHGSEQDSGEQGTVWP
jgi:hypothetical protein